MKEIASPTREQLLRVLLAQHGAMTLSELADRVGVRPPTALEHLRVMAAQGLVARSEARPPVYSPRPFFRATWVDPDRGIMASWTSNAPVSWSYPLVSRVRDERAQGVLLQFLRRIEAKRLLQGPARSRRRGPPRGDRTVERAVLVVYGSHARGDARSGSDVDVLVVHPRSWNVRARLRDVAAEMSLRVRPHVDVHAVTSDEIAHLHPTLRKAILEEGIVVHSTDGSGTLEPAGPRTGIHAARSHGAARGTSPRVPRSRNDQLRKRQVQRRL